MVLSSSIDVDSRKYGGVDDGLKYERKDVNEINSRSQISDNNNVDGYQMDRLTEANMDESDEPTANKKLTRRQWLILLVLMYANFFEASCYSLLAPFFPQLAESKNASPKVYGIIIGILEVVIFVTSPVFGRLVCRIAPNYLIMGGLFVAGANAIAFGALEYVPAGNPFIFTALTIRIFQGIGVSAFLTSNYALMAREFPDQIAFAFGILEVFFAMGTSIGPTMGGALNQVAGYSAPFIVLGSFLIFGVILAKFMLPMIETGKYERNDNKFTRLMRDKGVVTDLAVITFTFMIAGLLNVTFETHLRQFHLTPSVVGAIFIIYSVSYALASPVVGRLLDRKFPPKIMSIICTLVCCIGYIFIGPVPFLHIEPKIWIISISLFIIGVCNSAKALASFISIMATATGKLTFKKDLETYGLISGLFFTCSSIGLAIGPSVGGFCLEYFGFGWTWFGFCYIEFIMAILLIFNVVSYNSTAKEPEMNPLLNSSY